MREIVLDTETTGLDPKTGDRVVEIGCVELHNHMATGETFHTYVNPERDMPAEAERVHGLSIEFLSDKPLFADIADDFLAFVGSSPVIAHNAPFDLGFLNAELETAGREPLSKDRAIDTVPLARRKFPGAQVNLDALCRRFNVDLSARVKHGALLDSELLAEVYLELIGGREPGLGLAADERSGKVEKAIKIDRPIRPSRPHDASPDEHRAHAAFLEKIQNPIWKI
ncbi:MAG: DNA polymerase III subunit epsilon [Alphaproteobacteria bacterium]|nr:DNA polymerase III subunit epsilon [Alphaproteobacteria bacterium]